MRLAGQHGFAGVTEEAIAAKADVDAAHVRLHVQSLDQLLAEAYADAADHLFGIYAAGFDSATDWVTRFEAGAAAIAAVYALDPCLARTCEVEVLTAGPLARGARDAAIRRAVHFVHSRLGVDAGIPPVHFELVCGALCHAFGEDVEAGRLERAGERAGEVAALFAPVVV